MANDRRHHPAALRNRDPILDALRSLLPPETDGAALEVGSGSGCHVEHFSTAFPRILWQPSEYASSGADARAVLADIDAVGCAAQPNVAPAVALDASAAWEEWPAAVREKEKSHSLVYASNVTHISPWRVTCGLIAGAGRALRANGLLVLYGPFKVDGGFTTENNRQIDTSLRGQDPEWGYRDVADVAAVAVTHGLKLKERREMPANNVILCFCKES